LPGRRSKGRQRKRAMAHGEAIGGSVSSNDDVFCTSLRYYSYARSFPKKTAPTCPLT